MSLFGITDNQLDFDTTENTKKQTETAAKAKPKAPEQPNVGHTTKIVFDYLANNAEALSFYKKKYLFITMDELTDGQIKEIYEHLKKHNKI